MGRTKQTARKSTGGKAPRRQLATASARAFKSYATSLQRVGRGARFKATPHMSSSAMRNQKSKAVFINHENTFSGFSFLVPEVSQGSTSPAASSTSSSTDVAFRPCGSFARVPATAPHISTTDEEFLGITFASKYNGAALGASGLPCPIALTLVLDVSGSMAWQMSGDGDNRTPRSRFGWGANASSGGKSKLEVAKSCMSAIFRQLKACDCLSIVLFNHQQRILLPPTRVSAIDEEKLMHDVENISAGGGTKLDEGLSFGVSQTRTGGEILAHDNAEGVPILKRTMFLTDMDSSLADEDAVIATATAAASESPASLHTSIIGIDVDLSLATMQKIAGIPGCTYMSVSNEKEFAESIATEFAYDVLPIAFDVRIQMLPSDTGDEYVFEAGFGSTELSALNNGDTVARLSAEFPAPRNPENGEIKGALRLFRVRRKTSQSTGKQKAKQRSQRKRRETSDFLSTRKGKGKGKESKQSSTISFESSMKLCVQWKDCFGKELSYTLHVPVPVADTTEYYADSGLRKGIALTRYVDMLNAYCLDDDPDVDMTSSSDEANQKALTKHQTWHDKFKALQSWLLNEMNATGDDSIFGKDKSNNSIKDTIVQIIGLEKKEIQKYTKQCQNSNYCRKLRSRKRMLPHAGDANSFKCPILMEIMKDPVIAADGFSYERAAITKWLSTNKNSPMTGLPLPHLQLISNQTLKSAIAELHK